MLVLAAVTLILASGCAFGTRRVNLTYEPAPNIAAQAARGRIAVARLRDARTADEGTGVLLGKVRNLYGMPTASVEANQDPVLWVNEAIVRALAGYGFEVEKVETAASAGDLPTVTGSVERVSGGMYMSMDAHIRTDLSIQYAGTSLFGQRCEGEASQGAGFVSAEEWRKVFRKAMDAYVMKCVLPLVPTLQEHSER
jgi:hypothetical protein